MVKTPALDKKPTVFESRIQLAFLEGGYRIYF